MNRIDKLLNLREGEINKIKDKKGNTITDNNNPPGNQGKLKIHSNKLENLQQMGTKTK